MPDRELIQAWLTKATRDLNTAQIIFSELPEYDDMIAFHCQQAIEKTLKAYLIYLDIEFRPVHDLGYLMNLISTKDQSLESFFDKVDKISRYAVQIRYPDSVINLSKSHIQDAIATADSLVKLLFDRIK